MSKSPAEYVNPYIGTIGHLLTSTRPVTALPHSWAGIFPTVTPNVMDYYTAERILSFPRRPRPDHLRPRRRRER